MYAKYRNKFQRELDSNRTSKKRKEELRHVIAEIDKHLDSQRKKNEAV